MSQEDSHLLSTLDHENTPLFSKLSQEHTPLLTLIIPGDPIPLKRHRTNRGRSYDPQSEIKQKLLLSLFPQLPKEPFKFPLHVVFTFFMPIPRSFSKKKKARLDGTPHFRRCDLSNNLKFAEDLLNKKVWLDDSLISSLTAHKIYSFEPRTIIEIYEYK